jgi:hypothetical protein
MRTRLLTLALVACGLMLSGGGAGLAVSGLSTQGDSGVAQYGTTPTIPGLPCDVNGDGVVTEDEDKNGPGVPGCEEAADGGVQGAQDAGGNLPTVDKTPPLLDAPLPTTDAAPQAPRQVEAGADAPGQLPFTGFAAIPILLAGLTLLGGGLVLRRRTARDDA